MPSFSKLRRKILKQKIFTSPGTLEYIGKDVSQNTVIKIIQYNEASWKEKIAQSLQDCVVKNPVGITWINVDGIHESKLLEDIGTLYQLHPLLLEDVLNTTQKPKIEEFENCLFVVIKMLKINKQNGEFESEHVALVLNENYLISFQEQHDTDIFLSVLERIKNSVGKTRKGKTDYLLFALMDLIVDNYFLVLEQLNDQLEQLENDVFNNPKPQHQTDIYTLKRELTLMRKYVTPLRDMLNAIIREEFEGISNSTLMYFRDLSDHVTQVIDNIESCRDTLDNLMNIYLASLSNRMNSVMKTLTVYTAIFMPLSFIAGVYGMNFDNMPELHQPQGYFYTLYGMAGVFVSLLIYFRWRKFL